MVVIDFRFGLVLGMEKAVASWTCEAGKRDRGALVTFLEGNRHVLATSTVTAASKLLPDDVRRHLRR